MGAQGGESRWRELPLSSPSLSPPATQTRPSWHPSATLMGAQGPGVSSLHSHLAWPGRNRTCHFPGMKCFPDPCADLAGVNQQVPCARNWLPQTSIIPKGTPFGGPGEQGGRRGVWAVDPQGRPRLHRGWARVAMVGGQAAAPPVSTHLPASPQVAGAPFPTCDDLQPLLCRLRAGALSVRKQ